MNKRVICHLCDFAPEYPGSFIDSLLYLSRHCRQAVHVDTICIFPERAQNRPWLAKLDEEGIRYAFVAPKRNIARSLRNILKDVYPVIFHSHFSTFDLSAFALKCLFFRSSKVVLHLHSVAEPSLTQRLKDAIKVGALGRSLADRVVPVGDSVFANAVSRGYRREKMSLIHNGINTRHFVSDDAARRTTRKAFGVSDDETVFLALGYNPRIKGVDIFMEAAAKAVEQGAAKSIFVVIGRDATRDFVAQRPECARLGASLRIIAPTERFGELLNGIDVLVSPSRSEGFSYALAEAMSSQKLVLVSDILGMREIYGRAHGAWLYTPHNSAALANLIARVGRLSVNERAHLGEMNRNYIVERHSLETWCKAMGNLYATLLPAVARGLE